MPGPRYSYVKKPPLICAAKALESEKNKKTVIKNFFIIS
jgi:hypothetical protein